MRRRQPATAWRRRSARSPRPRRETTTAAPTSWAGESTGPDGPAAEHPYASPCPSPCLPVCRFRVGVSGYELTYIGRYWLKCKDPDAPTVLQEAGGGAARSRSLWTAPSGQGRLRRRSALGFAHPGQLVPVRGLGGYQPAPNEWHPTYVRDPVRTSAHDLVRRQGEWRAHGKWANWPTADARRSSTTTCCCSPAPSTALGTNRAADGAKPCLRRSRVSGVGCQNCLAKLNGCEAS